MRWGAVAAPRAGPATSPTRSPAAAMTTIVEVRVLSEARMGYVVHWGSEPGRPAGPAVRSPSADDARPNRVPLVPRARSAGRSRAPFALLGFAERLLTHAGIAD